MNKNLWNDWWADVKLTLPCLEIAGQKKKKKKRPVSSYSNYDDIFSSNSDLIMLRVWIAILIIPSWKCSEWGIGAAGRRSSYLCRVANVWTFYFMWIWRGRRFLVSIKKIPNKKCQTDNRNEHEGRRGKREWRRENGCPLKVKYWSERRKNLRRECVCVCVCERERERKEEKQWWESALVRERKRERGRVRSDRVTGQKEDRKWGGKA